MSEQPSFSPEVHKPPSSPEQTGEQIETAEHAKHTPEGSQETPDTNSLEKQAKQIAEHAKTQESTTDKSPQIHQETIIGQQKELKQQKYQQLTHKIRSHLNPTERSFSKVVHNPVVEAISETSSKTVARPSGLLGGGIVALLGSGALLFMSKYYGFRYNFFVYILMFGVGFVAGVFIELGVRIIKKK